jgi:hypothetical protein
MIVSGTFMARSLRSYAVVPPLLPVDPPAPVPGPNPIRPVQAPFTGWLTVTDVAVTVPTLSVVPRAFTQTPALRASAEAATVSV